MDLGLLALIIIVIAMAVQWRLRWKESRRNSKYLMAAWDCQHETLINTKHDKDVLAERANRAEAERDLLKKMISLPGEAEVKKVRENGELIVEVRKYKVPAGVGASTDEGEIQNVVLSKEHRA